MMSRASFVVVCVLFVAILQACATSGDKQMKEWEALRPGSGDAGQFGVNATCSRPSDSPPSAVDLCWVVAPGSAGWPSAWDSINVTLTNSSSQQFSVNYGALCIFPFSSSVSLAANSSQMITLTNKSEICIPYQGTINSQFQVTAIAEGAGPQPFTPGSQCTIPAGDTSRMRCWTAQKGGENWPPQYDSVVVTYSNPGSSTIKFTSGFACGVGSHSIAPNGSLTLTYHHKNVVCLDASSPGPTTLQITNIQQQ